MPGGAGRHVPGGVAFNDRFVEPLNEIIPAKTSKPTDEQLAKYGAAFDAIIAGARSAVR